VQLDSPLHHSDFWASFWPGLWIVGVVLAAVGVLLGITSGRGRARPYGILGGLVGGGALFFSAVVLIVHGVSGEL
jgi:hypothetical protein